MRLGILVDGEAEYRSLPVLLPRIETPYTLVGVFKADIQPKASSGQIAYAVNKRRSVLSLRGADGFLILIDREDRTECAGEWAGAILTDVNAGSIGPPCAGVVVKDRTFENWLLADAAALQSMPKRFRLPQNVINQVNAGLADSLDAQRRIKEAALKHAYDKVSDAVRILSAADPTEIAQGSRSFRKLLREVGNPEYKAQSKIRCAKP